MATARRLLIGVTAMVLIITATTATNAAASSVAPDPGAGAAPEAAARRSFYLSPRGSDSNSGSSRSPWRTISRASRSMRAGDTLYVRGGTYTGQGGDLWRGPSGTASRPITIRKYGHEKPVFDGQNSIANFWILSGSQSYITIIGLTATRYTGSGAFVLTDSVHHVRLSYNVITNNGTDDAQDHGIYLAAPNVHDITIDSNYIAHNAAGCIHFFHTPSAKRVLISRNRIIGCRWGIILAGRPDSIRILHNTIVDNQIGIDIWDATRVTVRDNIVSSRRRSDGLGVGMWVERLSSLAYEDYNLWYREAGTPITTGSKSGGRFWSVSGWRAGTRFSNHSREGNPRFISAADLRLQTTSPARKRASDGTNMGRF